MTKTHAAIIEQAGASKVAAAIGVGAGVVRMWKQRDSIPAERWRQLADKDIATLEELADAAARAA